MTRRENTHILVLEQLSCAEEHVGDLVRRQRLALDHQQVQHLGHQEAAHLGLLHHHVRVVEGSALLENRGFRQTVEGRRYASHALACTTAKILVLVVTPDVEELLPDDVQDGFGLLALLISRVVRI